MCGIRLRSELGVEWLSPAFSNGRAKPYQTHVDSAKGCEFLTVFMLGISFRKYILFLANKIVFSQIYPHFRK